MQKRHSERHREQLSDVLSEIWSDPAAVRTTQQ